jgi:hypothetical protein
MTGQDGKVNTGPSYQFMTADEQMAHRMAKALSDAVTHCGGKPESY